MMGEDRELAPRGEDFAAWYNEVVIRAELAGYTPVRGCFVIRPYGYALWELMRDALDQRFKATGHENAYFPLLIPESHLEREAEHVEGFAPETARVTHGGGEELDEALVVRPTSEAIIWPIMADWIQSYRDLPLLIHQWANVVRWEMRTRPFLRTLEFLWQEGHTAHADEDDAEEEARRVLGLYRRFMEEWMAMPPVTGRKTDRERFAGAVRTYSCEALMQDNWALQVGTSHNLGQNFARAFDVQFQTEEGKHDFVWGTSWGISTRLLGALVMTHGDDLGLVLPPKLAPVQVVIVPIWESEDQRPLMLEVAGRVKGVLQRQIRVRLDDRDTVNPASKFDEWDRKGVPIRLEIGPQDVSRQRVTIVRRFSEGEDRGKRSRPEGEALATLPRTLNDMQRELYRAALDRRSQNSHRGVTDRGRFTELLREERGFVYAGWCGAPECEQRIKKETKATIRVLPDEEFQSQEEPEICVVCGAESMAEALWARAY